MPRSNSSRAQPKPARETSSSRERRPSGTRASPRRLAKRVVQKPDGRYLIYYEQA